LSEAGTNHCLTVAGTNLFAGIFRSGVFLSSDNGTSWTAVNTGLTYTDVLTLTVSGSNLFAGTQALGVWRRPLSEMITSVGPVTSDVPHEFMLHQNYPNPFNPSTTIRYEFPRASHVTLTVYDLLGREVATLVNGVQGPGYKSVEWNASRMSSGVYFYQLTAGDPSTGSGPRAESRGFIQTRKLLLLR
jgi:hypothetical protein